MSNVPAFRLYLSEEARLRRENAELTRQLDDAYDKVFEAQQQERATRVRHDRMLDYCTDLQRIIEALCAEREIPEPQTEARYHYRMAKAHQAALAKKEPA